ncbi:histidinol-phosphate transaminase [Ferrimonas gelatinilytica]|uniref:Histidinol-phosphate aminotransferase n=1 Tax=Ferrimonas gelatinilytica TaxID=1255257 RepID=A0ABP9RVJ4_9GAMM
MDILALAQPGVSGLHPYQPGKPVEELEREMGIREIVKLASNENPLGASPKVAAAIAEQSEQICRYPDANGFYLKQALSAILGVGGDQITLGNGSNEVLEILFRTFVGAGDEVIFDAHAFIVYRLLTQASGATAVAIPSQDWGHDLDAMLLAITEQTKLICIANPNNPTGTFLSKEALASFMSQVPKQVLVVLDEAYFEYVPVEERAPTVEWLAQYPNLCVSRTFSKAYGLAGLRVGYLVSSAEIADLLNRVREPFNCNSLALAGAQAALADQEFVTRSVELNRTEMARLESYCQERGIDYILSYANFITMKLTPADEIYQALLTRGVIVRPIAGYGMPDHLRVSIGLPQENDRFMAALDELLVEARP